MNIQVEFEVGLLYIYLRSSFIMTTNDKRLYSSCTFVSLPISVFDRFCLKKFRLKMNYFIVLFVPPVFSNLISSNSLSANNIDHNPLLGSVSSNVDELLTPWDSAPFISITTQELMVKFLVMLFPLMCIIAAIQAYVSYFGPSNDYNGYDGTRSLPVNNLKSSLVETAQKIIPYLTRDGKQQKMLQY